MKGSEARWMALDEIDELDATIPQERWLFHRAIELYRLWSGAPPVALEPGDRPEQTS